MWTHGQGISLKDETSPAMWRVRESFLGRRKNMCKSPNIVPVFEETEGRCDGQSSDSEGEWRDMRQEQWSGPACRKWQQMQWCRDTHSGCTKSTADFFTPHQKPDGSGCPWESVVESPQILTQLRWGRSSSRFPMPFKTRGIFCYLYCFSSNPCGSTETLTPRFLQESDYIGT